MALLTILNELRVRDNTTFALTPPKSVNTYVLAANTAVNINVSDLIDSAGIRPAALMFQSTGTFFIQWNATGAAIPGTSITDGTGLEIDPTTRRIGADITSFSLVSAAGCVVSIALYSQIN